MRLRKSFLVMTVLMMASLTNLVQAQGGSATLHGIVIALKGGPVVNARVVAEGAAGEATTNGNGEYRLAGMAPGVHKVTITAPGYDAFEIQINVAATGDTEADAVMMATPVPAAVAQGPGVEGATPASAPVAAQQTVVAAQNISVKPERGRAALYGLTTDQTGAVIAGGTATVAFPGGKPTTVTANEQGLFVLNGLAPGQYHLKVTAAGFAPFETDTTLASDQALELDATLLPPSSVTNVDVTASTGGAEVKTDTAQIEGTITEKEVVKTGLNGRNFTQLIALAPGVSNQTGQDEAMVGLKGSVKYSVNGGRVEYNNFDVDGGDVLNAGLNGAESTLMVYPSLDAISEVKVLTSNYGAMYGRTASGTVLVTTKSGLPKYHGGLYDFVRNEFFNARNYFDLTKKAPLYRRQDFGGTFGGPLYKDKTYFFWSEEFRLEKTPQEFSQAVPSMAERGIGVTNCSNAFLSTPCADFSDVCPLPSSTSVNIDRALYPDCPAEFAGPLTYAFNLVPIDPTTQAFLATGMIPLPNATGGCNSSLSNTVNFATQQPNVPCYNAVISPSTYWREELARLDHSFTQNMRLSFRYIHDTWNTTVLTPQWGYIVNSFPTVQNKLNGPGTSMVVRFDSNSSTLLNDLVVSYVDAHINITDINGPGATLTPIPSCAASGSMPGCISYLFDNGQGGKPPGLIFSGTNAQYGGSGFQVDPSYAPWEHTNPTYSLSDNVTKQIGGVLHGHQLQFGIQVTDAQRRENNAAIGSATGDLQGLLTFDNQNNQTTGNSFADFLVGGGHGGIKSYQQDSAQLKYYNDYWIAEPYVQDDWHMSQHLTLNLGLRLSLFQNFHEKYLNAYNWDPNAYQTGNTAGITLAGPGSNAVGYFVYTGNAEVPVPFTWNGPTSSLPSVLTNGLVQCGKNGVPASCATNHVLNPAPRIGFAWDPKGDGKTSIRGGYGVFFEHGTPKEANTGSLEGGAPLVLTMTDPFPSAYSAIGLGCNNALTCPNNVPVAFPLDVTSTPTKTVWPYVQQWSLSLQQQLPKSMVATVAYVGSKGTHLSALRQLNQLAVPPTGPDNGIFPDGNPYMAHQPITFEDCSLNSSGDYTVNQITITPLQPAFQNLAAACYGSKNPVNGQLSLANNPNLFRPYFGFQRILGLQDIADSQYHALQATIRRTKGPFTVGGSYTYSHSLDDASDRSDASFVNSANIRSSWASSNFDQRHLLNLNYIYDVPKISHGFQQSVVRSSGPDAGPSAGTKVLGILLDSWQISGVTVFQSGTPFSIINSGSNTGISVLDNAGVANGSGAGSYPDVVAGLKAPLAAGVSKFNAQSFGPLLYNPAAFAAPEGLTFGDAGRNYVNNPHRINFDLSALKNFKLAEGHNLEFRLEAFNVFNHTQFRIFNPNIGNAANNTISCYGGGLGGAPYTAAGGLTILPGASSSQPENVDCTTGSAFLHPIDAHRPRTLQLGLKYSF